MFTNIGLLQENSNFYVKLTISQGTKRPYYLSDKGLKPTGVYVRSGTTSSPASEDSIKKLLIYAQCSADYDLNNDITKDFFPQSKTNYTSL